MERTKLQTHADGRGYRRCHSCEEPALDLIGGRNPGFLTTKSTKGTRRNQEAQEAGDPAPRRGRDRILQAVGGRDGHSLPEPDQPLPARVCPRGQKARPLLGFLREAAFGDYQHPGTTWRIDGQKQIRRPRNSNVPCQFATSVGAVLLAGCTFFVFHRGDKMESGLGSYVEGIRQLWHMSLSMHCREH